MTGRSSPSLRLLLAALCAAMLLPLAAPDADAASRVRPYKPGGAIRLDTDLLSTSGVSAWAIDEYLDANTPLPRLGTAFLAAERRYGINARFLLAAAMHESNWGKSYISRTKHNLFGYNAYDRDPVRYATAFEGYAHGIDGVARFMKESYLSRSGRWWGGAPTLRSMQRFWSSSGRWGENVSRIATSLKLDSLRRRKLRFEAPVPAEVVRTGERGTVRIAWQGGRLPGGIAFRATWEQLEAEAPVAESVVEEAASNGADGHVARSTPSAGSSPLSGAAAADPLGGPRGVVPVPTLAPRPLQEPLRVKAKRTKLARSSAVLRVPAPTQPGEYRLTIHLRDRDGAVLPRADAVSIPAVRVRVFGDWAVRYATERVGDDGVVVTVTNVGHQAIPISPLPTAVADRLGRPRLRDTELVLHAYDPGHPEGFNVATVPLTEALAPGSSVAVFIDDVDRFTSAADLYLVPELLVFDDPDRLGATPAAGFWFKVPSNT